MKSAIVRFASMLPLLCWFWGNLGHGQEAAAAPKADRAAMTATVTGFFCWRDWMPIVAKPGPDHGSPLMAKATCQLDNTGSGAVKLACAGTVKDADGKAHPVKLKMLAADQETAWDGALAAGEKREVRFRLVNDDLYLAVGSKITLVIVLTDGAGHDTTVETVPAAIERTD